MEQEVVPVWPALLMLALFAVVFMLFWCAVIWLISQLSGWARLAQRYHSLRPTTGKVWRWQYGMIGWAGYNGVLTLTANAEGLFMETLWLFSFGHPRLFIPWHEFREAKVQRYFFRRQVKAKIGFPPLAIEPLLWVPHPQQNITVRLPAAVFEESEGRKVLVSPQ